MMADNKGKVLSMTPENLAILQAEVAAKRERKEERAAKRLEKEHERQLRLEVTV